LLNGLKTRQVIRRIRRKSFYDWMIAAGSIWTRFKSKVYYPFIFGGFGETSVMWRPLAVINPQYIQIGEGVTIRPGVRLEVIALHADRPPQLRIGRNVGIEQNVHIVCHHRVIIGNDVSITANCAIVDTTHPFDGIPANVKVGSLIQDDEASVEIGDGSFLGFGCVVLPNVRIGAGCVIGANSVVTRDIPDYSVAAGAPARVLRSISKLPAR
jgi:acetyltransferase-like isoleucine patch superfamily enzyme